MKVCLISPPRLLLKGSVLPPAFPPLGIALLAGVLLQKGHTVYCIDAIAENHGQLNNVSLEVNSQLLRQSDSFQLSGLTFEEIISRIHPDTELIGFSCMFSINWVAERELINQVSKCCPKATIVAGGEAVSGLPELYLQQCKGLDICVVGEGEETLAELCHSIENNIDLSKVNGIVFREKIAGRIVSTPRRERVRKIEEIPIPAWELLPYMNYIKHQATRDGSSQRISLPILATRGCPYTCTFCSSPQMWGTRYFMRSPEHVFNEVKYLFERFNATTFELFDLTAIIQKRWILEFTQLIIDSGLDIVWRIPAGTRSEAIDALVSSKLRESGCLAITYAPESGSKKLLEKIHKKVDLEHMLLSMKGARSEGMRVLMNMIAGLPGETHADVWYTFWFLIRSAARGVNNMNLQFYLPYPGSRTFKELVDDKVVSLDNDDFLIQSLFTADTVVRKGFYNPNISYRAYFVYYFLYHLAFYGTTYLLNPRQLLKMPYNIVHRTYSNDFEFYIRAWIEARGWLTRY